MLLKGNHDYWWTTVTSMKNFLKENNFENIDFLYNNSFEFENCILVGTRGWNTSDEAEDKKLIKRELNRLELSIKDGIERSLKSEEEKLNAKDIDMENEIIAFLHYCPISEKDVENNKPNEFIELLNKYKIKKCYYGHLHGLAIKDAMKKIDEETEKMLGQYSSLSGLM